MPVPVTDYISTTAPSDTFATHDSLLGKGGYREVVNHAARDAITTERRRVGMMVYTQNDGSTWQLGGDLTTWTSFSGGGGGGTSNSSITLEAGEDLVVGDPVYVLASKLYKADNVTNFRTVGIVTAGASMTFLATITMSGQISLVGLAANSPYFLGNGTITSVAPSAGYVVRVGQAISDTIFVVNIEEPVLLS